MATAKTAPSRRAEKNNMQLWEQVCETDPTTTKKVNQRGGFTAICAQGQRKAATKVFGIYGIDWGLKDLLFSMVEDGAGTPVELCLSAVFYFTFNGEFGSFPISVDKAYRVGDDSRKKIITDATTKALSMLGFNSDVFEGKFDDNKYVQDMKEKFNGKNQEPHPQSAPQPAAKSNPKPTEKQAEPAKEAGKEIGKEASPEVDLFKEGSGSPAVSGDDGNIGIGNEAGGSLLPDHNPDDIESMFKAVVAVANDAKARALPPNHMGPIMGLAIKTKQNKDIDGMRQLLGSLELYLGQNPAEREETLKVFIERGKK